MSHDPELDAYRARLKKPSLRISPVLVGSMMLPVIALGAIYVATRPRESDPAVDVAPPPPTPQELAVRALQPAADQHAGTDAETLEEGDVALAKGRKVLFVEQSLDLDPKAAKLLGAGPRLPRRRPMLPKDFLPGSAGPLATLPADAGVVVLVRTVQRAAGTYSGGSEVAYDLDCSATAVLVPERRRIATFSHTVHAPPTALRMNGLLAGGLTSDDGAWLRTAAEALSEGRAP